MASNLLAAPASEVIGQCLDEIETLRAELATLKAAARPVVEWYKPCAHEFSKTITVRFDELARLCGEE